MQVVLSYEDRTYCCRLSEVNESGVSLCCPLPLTVQQGHRAVLSGIPGLPGLLVEAAASGSGHEFWFRVVGAEANGPPIEIPVAVELSTEELKQQLGPCDLGAPRFTTEGGIIPRCFHCGGDLTGDYRNDIALWSCGETRSYCRPCWSRTHCYRCGCDLTTDSFGEVACLSGRRSRYYCLTCWPRTRCFRCGRRLEKDFYSTAVFSARWTAKYYCPDCWPRIVARECQRSPWEPRQPAPEFLENPYQDLDDSDDPPGIYAGYWENAVRAWEDG